MTNCQNNNKKSLRSYDNNNSTYDLWSKSTIKKSKNKNNY